jgi:hypothetical protein
VVFCRVEILRAKSAKRSIGLFEPRLYGKFKGDRALLISRTPSWPGKSAKRVFVPDVPAIHVLVSLDV